MAIVVEDGTGLTTSNSYVSEADLTAYAALRSYTLVATAARLLIAAMDYLEIQSYIGDKGSKAQALLWPRVPCVSTSYNYVYSLGFSTYGLIVDGYPIESNEIPTRLKKAQMELALNFDSGDDFLATQEQAVISEKIGPIETKYQKGTSSALYMPQVSLLLAPLLRSGGANISVSRA